MDKAAVQQHGNLSAGIRVAYGVTLDVSFPAAYPHVRPLIRLLGVQARDQHEQLNASIKALLDDKSDGELVLFDVFQLVLEQVNTHNDVQEAGSSPVPTELQLKQRRILLWSHHLIADSKRKDLQALAHNHLTIIAKIGWPGYIAAEGEADIVQDFMKEVKSWRWQAISLRYDVQHDFAHGALLNITGYLEVQTIAELAKHLAVDPDWFVTNRHSCSSTKFTSCSWMRNLLILFYIRYSLVIIYREVRHAMKRYCGDASMF
jgi:hypothetical protein